KIEGNKQSIITKGGTSAKAQASVLSLYDGARYKGPRKGKENISWEQADKEVKSKLDELKQKGAKVALFTSTIASPSTKAVIKDFIAAYPNVEHLVYDPISYSGLLDANEQMFGIRAIPDYQFSKAKVIVGVGADYLGTWLNHTEYETDWAVNRRVSKQNPRMSKTFHIESVPTVTGYKADVRIPVKPAHEEASLIAIYNIVAGKNIPGGYSNPKIEAAAKALISAPGEGLLVCGINDVKVQLLVNAINLALRNYGNTISFERPVYIKQGSDAAAATLYDGLKNGTYKGVLFYESNPVYQHPRGKELADLIANAELSVSFANRLDETSSVCNYVLPDNHYLESWNDIEVKAGIINTVQPTISRLFDTRQFQETLLTYAGKPANYYEYIRQYWENNFFPKQSRYPGFLAFWDNTLHDGEVVLNINPATVSARNINIDDVAAELAKEISSYGEAQVKLYETISVGDGTYADNPWLLELPDPVTKVTWGNYIVVSPSFAKKNDLLPDLNSKEYHVLKLKVGEQEIELPVVAVPGTPEGTFGIPLGFGRTAVNHDLLKNGKNAFPLLKSGKEICGNVTFSKTGKTEKLAITQTHHTLTLKGLGGVRTRKIVKEATLEEYIKNPRAGNEDREEILHELVTLYPTHERPGHHWTMVIDLNTCTGCSACVVACNAENNIPVVGKDQVIRAREMHWLRIDRYFTGSEEDPTVVFQPMLCQHCDNAPCENVCPVAATNHSSEGLNQMTYNRCIGTRYCANNCPYKVRRFNWYDYAGNDSFDKKWGTGNDEGLASYQLGLREPLSRMVLNPDVTVRSRGVIEKCSFCVQRLQDAKLTAKKENRILRDGEAQTACQTACPTNAITFGDRNNKEAAVTALFSDERAFGVVEELHTLPNVLYLTQIRNTVEEKKV
ncbi:MAG: 4Fe-4S dicluster domain-containing protein, partial [Chitinophagales bacterium]|nr:4Fe-4S dicluster domain-containing protein [Chitinophagales bacterium]